jgi:cytoskeletal protein RodZ
MEDNNLNPQLEQEQKLKEIGERLHEIRIERGVSLDTICDRTMISKRLLEAIERGNFAELPELFYVKALMVKYARALNALDLVDSLQAKPAVVVSDRVKTASNNAKSRNLPSFQLNFQLNSLHLYIVYIVLIIIAVRGLASLVESPTTVVTQTPETQISPTTNQPNRESNKDLPQLISQSSNADSVTVGINLQERCWLKVMVDGKVAFEGVLTEGTQKTWEGKEEVTIRAGNAGGVVVTFNNGQKKILGKPGQVEEVTYTVN